MASEEAIVGLREIRDEVLRKIGRNLLIFQDIERTLKSLVVANSFPVTPASDTSAFAQTRARFEQQTFGQIKSQYVDRVLLGSQQEFTADEGQEIRMGSSFALEADDARVVEINRVLDELIVERNQLVHHFLQTCDLRSAQSLSDAARMLDEQIARALEVRRGLQGMIDTIQDSFQEIQRFVDSPEGQSEINLWLLQSSTVVARLLWVAAQYQRPDGWTVLDRAWSLLKEEIAAGLSTLMSRHGVRRLKDLLVISQVFDVVEESTARGGTRTIYRPKSFEQQ